MSMNIDKLCLCCIIRTYKSVCYQQKQRVWLGYSKQHGDLVPLTLLVPLVTKINFLLSISIHCQQISYEN